MHLVQDQLSKEKVFEEKACCFLRIVVDTHAYLEKGKNQELSA